jgi:hypothetical protein
MMNDTKEPLLYIDLDKEMQTLNYNYGLFKSHIEEIEKDLIYLQGKKITELEIANL